MWLLKEKTKLVGRKRFCFVCVGKLMRMNGRTSKQTPC